MGKKTDKKKYMGLFIIMVMVLSMFGAMFYGFTSGGKQETEYKGIIFYYNNNGFSTEINEQEVFFTTFPADLEYITIDEGAKKLLKEDYFIVTYDSKSNLATEMAMAQYKLFEERLKPLNKVVVRALTNTTEAVLPQKNCEDGTEKNPVILLEYGNTTKVISKDNCIIAKANSAQEVYQVSDRIVYEMFEVMK